MVSFSPLPVLIPKYHSLPKRRHAYCRFVCHLVKLNKWHLYFYPSSDTLVRFQYVSIRFRPFRSLSFFSSCIFYLSFHSSRHLLTWIYPVNIQPPFHFRDRITVGTPRRRTHAGIPPEFRVNLVRQRKSSFFLYCLIVFEASWG